MYERWHLIHLTCSIIKTGVQKYVMTATLHSYNAEPNISLLLHYMSLPLVVLRNKCLEIW